MIKKLAFSMLLVLALPATTTMAQQLRTMQQGRITLPSHQATPGLQQLQNNPLTPAGQGLQGELNQLQNGRFGPGSR